MLAISVYAFSPFSQKPTGFIKYENNNGIIGIVNSIAPYAIIGGVANSVWLIFCFMFKPISKHFFFSQEQMEDPVIDITKVCLECGVGQICIESPKKCGKYTFKKGKWRHSLF
jgi:hypothetical protein